MGDYEFKFKVIRDAACGLIGLSKTELKILNLPIFQRLRRIHQNGFLSNVFPSATHTRFSHSLGVLYYADLMCKQIDVLTHQEKKIIRIAALLHDIGHSPFSHTIENVARDFLPMKTELTTHEPKVNEKYTLLKKIEEFDLIKKMNKIHKDKTIDKREFLGHEVIGSMIIENHPEINKILQEEFCGDYEEYKTKIQKSICGDIDDGIIMGILHSELDADKCDYLNRDSISSGVKYGLYEFQHIIENMVIDSENREIVFKYKALKSIEYFLFSRYFLYNQIYNHKTNLGFNWLAENAYRGLLKYNKFIRPEELIQFMENKDFSIFNTYDDYFFLTKCYDLYNELKKKSKIDKNEEFYLDILEKIVFRKPLKPVLICETFVDPTGSAPPSNPDYNVVEDFLKNRISDMSKSISVSEKWIVVDRGFQVPITKIPNKVPFGKSVLYNPEWKEEQITIKFDNGELKPINQVMSSIIAPLANLNLNGQFLFTKNEDYKNKIVEYIKKKEITSSKFLIE